MIAPPATSTARAHAHASGRRRNGFTPERFEPRRTPSRHRRARERRQRCARRVFACACRATESRPNRRRATSRSPGSSAGPHLCFLRPHHRGARVAPFFVFFRRGDGKWFPTRRQRHSKRVVFKISLVKRTFDQTLVLYYIYDCRFVRRTTLYSSFTLFCGLYSS